MQEANHLDLVNSLLLDPVHHNERRTWHHQLAGAAPAAKSPHTGITPQTGHGLRDGRILGLYAQNREIFNMLYL